jgi:hypothetical protein
MAAGAKAIPVAAGIGSRRFTRPAPAARVRDEAPLAVDPVAGDRGLAGGRDDPADEALAVGRLHLRMAPRVRRHDAVLGERPPGPDPIPHASTTTPRATRRPQNAGPHARA